MGVATASPIASVIVPFRNAAPCIRELLQALVAQNGSTRFEVVAVDNGSTDDSANIVSQFATALDLKVVNAADRRGPAYARNVGVRHAQTDKLLFVDADDLVDGTYVDTLAKALDHHALVTSRVDTETLNPPRVVAAHGGLWQTHGVSTFFDFLPAAGANIGVRRQLFETVGGFRESLSGSEDIAFSWDAQLSGGTQIIFVRDAVYHYRYRRDLWGLFRQAQNWGRDHVRLYEAFRRRGMPARHWRQGARDWVTASWRGVGARSWESRARAAVLLGYCIGRLHGTVRYGVWYF